MWIKNIYMHINNHILGISNNLHVNAEKKTTLLFSHRVPHYLLQWEHLIISKTLGKISSGTLSFSLCYYRIAVNRRNHSCSIVSTNWVKHLPRKCWQAQLVCHPLLLSERPLECFLENKKKRKHMLMQSLKLTGMCHSLLNA